VNTVNPSSPFSGFSSANSVLDRLAQTEKNLPTPFPSAFVLILVSSGGRARGQGVTACLGATAFVAEELDMFEEAAAIILSNKRRQVALAGMG